MIIYFALGYTNDDELLKMPNAGSETKVFATTCIIAIKLAKTVKRNRHFCSFKRFECVNVSITTEANYIASRVYLTFENCKRLNRPHEIKYFVNVFETLIAR
jgi:hypothetical protein